VREYILQQKLSENALHIDYYTATVVEIAPRTTPRCAKLYQGQTLSKTRVSSNPRPLEAFHFVQHALKPAWRTHRANLLNHTTRAQTSLASTTAATCVGDGVVATRTRHQGISDYHDFLTLGHWRMLEPAVQPMLERPDKPVCRGAQLQCYAGGDQAECWRTVNAGSVE
jgi:hypothetical protein